ncbi:Rieske 2Fe-2S domain-containing protein [Pendulispora albinea]|uniref:Aromatic ring-hydroxylating dioxygenase subunit alpha n=1 Tax=Pendulispora albinea TaxID=2741071 RepID=A0ABZ2LTL9_9BACT
MLIRNAWYAAALCNEIKSEELFARTLLNDKIVFYRTSEGKVAALEDRCIHRQVPLSKGRLKGDQIECWYHGLRYEPSGKCVHIPSQRTIPARACVRTYPVAEKYGWVWLWMGDPAQADEALVPDHWPCTSPEFAGEMSYFHINTDYRLAVDNLLDLSHIAYVHPKTIVSQAVAEATPEITVKENEVRVRRTLRNETTPPLLKQMMGLDHIDRVQEVVYWPVANTRVETFAHPPGRPEGPVLRLFTTSMFTPETNDSIHAWVGMHRDFALGHPKLTEAITKEVIVTVLEDKDVTEHLQNNWKNDAPLIHLAVDRAAFAAREILERLYTRENATRTDTKRYLVSGEHGTSGP